MEEYKKHDNEVSLDLSRVDKKRTHGEPSAGQTTESLLGGLGIEACKLEIPQPSCDTSGSRDRVHPRLQIVYDSTGLLFAIGRYRRD